MIENIHQRTVLISKREGGVFSRKRTRGEHFPDPGSQGLYLQTLRMRKSQGLYLQTLRVRKSQGLYLEILGSRGSSLACPLAPHPSLTPLASIGTKNAIPGASVILSGRTLVAEVARR
jgi:hypothetical protein